MAGRDHQERELHQLQFGGLVTDSGVDHLSEYVVSAPASALVYLFPQERQVVLSGGSRPLRGQ
ncbi:hypothetical protein JOF56_009245 [Kibdelosporangium banguiense]|uniref:Uncharacterized protein n=1 Tax=Kibdelosporangium banguiense TaxID=1365924 RepID=A0ABS4TWS5_9PSEU|nr:hypothetical protein [Kibdelosporangium banguiense]MBP2328860.1 hypothetical protein [Kibdelosporangium banguiense]